MGGFSGIAKGSTLARDPVSDAGSQLQPSIRGMFSRTPAHYQSTA